MARKTGTDFHIVIRPREENLPERSTLEIYFDAKAELYLISEEAGDGKSTNHFDCVVRYSGTKRTDVIHRALVTKFGIPEDESRNVKVYVIDDGNWEYQIGYSRKEGRPFGSNISAQDISRGVTRYKETDGRRPVENRARHGDRGWTADVIVAKYDDWLRAKDIELTESNVEAYMRVFKNENKHEMKFTTWQRINKKELVAWISH